MPAYEIEVDDERQVLLMRFRGVVTPAHLAAQAGRTATLIARMKPGFTVATHYRGKVPFQTLRSWGEAELALASP